MSEVQTEKNRRRVLAFICGLVALAAVVAVVRVAMLVSASQAVQVEITITGDGLDEAIIYRNADTESRPSGVIYDPDDIPDPFTFRSEGELVSLPWSETLGFDEDGEFSILAVNPGTTGELRCSAEWPGAFDGGLTWSRTNTFLAGCSGEVNFTSDGLVRLDPTGQSVSFEMLEEQILEAEADRAAVVDRLERVATATEEASDPGPVEIDGWRVELTGANRFERELVVEVTAERIAAEPGNPGDIQIGALGGVNVDPFAQENHECDPGYENWVFEVFELTDELARGEGGTWNVCLVLPEEEIPGALATVSVFLGDTAPIAMRLPVAGAVSNREVATDNAEFQEFETHFVLELLNAHVDDTSLLAERTGDSEIAIRSDTAWVMVDVSVTNIDPEQLGPIPPDLTVQWELQSADAGATYTDRDSCPGISSVIPAEPAPDGGWSPSDERFLAFPNEPSAFSACFEVAREDVPGLVLRLVGIDQIVNIDTGLE